MIAWKSLLRQTRLLLILHLFYPAQVCRFVSSLKQTKFSESTAEHCLQFISTHRNNFWFLGVPSYYRVKISIQTKRCLILIGSKGVIFGAKFPSKCLGMHVSPLHQCLRVSFASFACFPLDIPLILIMTFITIDISEEFSSNYASEKFSYCLIAIFTSPTVTTSYDVGVMCLWKPQGIRGVKAIHS